jgi:dTDP-4-amino-4,6-dideoxy-D-glucose transaminase
MKDNVRDLALFGGAPAFREDLLVGRPNVGDREAFLKRLEKVLDTGWFTHYGPLARQFERRVAETVGVEHCVLVANATTGLEIVLRAANLSGEVIMPSMTFIATPHSARFHGVRPVFCDVDPETGCLDPAEVERLITPRTTAILGVHLWGQPCAVDQLRKLADANGLVLYFDAAHAMACRADGRPIGGFGLAEVFSFHATKVVNSFEGGAIVSNDGEFAARARALHNFGLGPEGRPRHEGTNAKLTEAAAAMGLTSLEAMPDSIRYNEENYHAYHAELAEVPGVQVLSYDPVNRNNFQYLVIKVDESANGLRRDALLALLRAENVRAQRYFSPCCHELEPYSTENPVSLPRTEALSKKVLALPTGRSVSAEDVAGVSRLVRTAAAHGEEITRRWLAAA